MLSLTIGGGLTIFALVETLLGPPPPCIIELEMQLDVRNKPEALQ